MDISSYFLFFFPQNGVQANKPALSAIRQGSDFTLMAKLVTSSIYPCYFFCFSVYRNFVPVYIICFGTFLNRRIGRDLSNTFSKLEKLTIRKDTNCFVFYFLSFKSHVRCYGYFNISFTQLPKGNPSLTTRLWRLKS